MITIIAEKNDVASRICAMLGCLNYKNKKLTVQEVNKYKNEQEFIRFINSKGYLMANYNGEDYAITWTQGHIGSLYQFYDYNQEYANWEKIPFPFFPKEYKVKVKDGIDFKTGKKTKEPSPYALKQIKIIKKLVEQSKYVINATDDDREGEVIFLFTYKLINSNKPFKKMKMDSQTQEGLKKAFDNIFYDESITRKAMAGMARSIGDLDVGANISGLMTTKFCQDNKMLTYGRVQTVGLNELVEREKEIINFVSKPFWYLMGDFTFDSDNYKGKHIVKQFDTKEEAMKVFEKVNGKEAIITNKISKETTKEVPLLYNTDTIIIDANKKYGYSAKDVLELLEHLYMSGYITYPRTSSKHLTEDMKDEVIKILNTLKNNNEEYRKILSNANYPSNFTKRHFDNKKVESHFAIIPTLEYPNQLNTKEKDIYDLIAKSLLRIAFNKAIIEETLLETTIDGEIFKSKGSIVRDAQWLMVDTIKKDNLLPNVSIGDVVQSSILLKEGKTEPPSRYTDATLTTFLATASKKIGAEDLKEVLENHSKGGIGTGATRPGIIEIIKQRYATTNGKYIQPTEQAIKMIELLPIQDLKSAEMTAKWEKRLYEIELGNETLDDFLEDLHNVIMEWCEIINKTKETTIFKNQESSKYKCLCCNSPMRELAGGYICSSYSKNEESCNFYVRKSYSNINFTNKDIKDLFTKRRTGLKKGILKKDGKETYNAFFCFDEHFKVKPTINLDLKCPICGGNITLFKSNFSSGWKCENYKKSCNMIIKDSIQGVIISDSQKKKLLTNKITDLIVGFKKKDGSGTYDAYLCIEENGNVAFRFPQKRK